MEGQPVTKKLLVRCNYSPICRITLYSRASSARPSAVTVSHSLAGE